LLGREVKTEGSQGHIPWQPPFQPLCQPLYLPLSRQEHQGTASLTGERLQHHGANLGLQPLLAIGGAIVVLDGKAAPLGAHHGGTWQQALQGHAIQGGGHHQQLEIIAQPLLAFDGEGQRGIGVQAALVELVKDDERHAGELRILLQHPGQHPLGHDLEPGLAAGAALPAHSQADALAHLLPS
jgi:hypothetical protein